GREPHAEHQRHEQKALQRIPEDVQTAAEGREETAEQPHRGSLTQGLVHAVTKRFCGLTDTPGQEVPMSHLNLNLNPMSEPPARAAASGTESRLEIDATRARQTERPAAPFRSVLAGGVSLLMSGAEVATHVVGGPILAAAVHDARARAAQAPAGARAGLA